MSVRVYALSRDHDIPSKDVVDACVQLGIDVKSHMSAISEEDAARVLQAIKNRGARPHAAAPSSSAGAAPSVAGPIRREDYISASGVSAKVPDLTKPAPPKPAKPAEDEKKPVEAGVAKPKVRPLPKLGGATSPVLRPIVAPKPEPQAPEQSKAQKPLMPLSPVALRGALKDRPTAPPSAPSPTGVTPSPALSKPAPKTAAPPPLKFEPPSAKPAAAEKRHVKGKPLPRIDEEEDDRSVAHRAGAVAGREERQKKRGRRAAE